MHVSRFLPGGGSACLAPEVGLLGQQRNEDGACRIPAEQVGVSQAKRGQMNGMVC